MEASRIFPLESMTDLLEMVPRPDSDEGWSVDVDGARLARELKAMGIRRIGLLPADDRVDVLSVARTLGRALSVLTETLVLVLDIDRKLAPEPERAAQHPGSAVLDAGVAALLPASVPGPGEKASTIAALLDRASDPPDCVGRVIVDLSSCVRPGELLGSLALVDGVIIVGKSAVCREDAVLATIRRVPPEKSLGVLLIE